MSMDTKDEEASPLLSTKKDTESGIIYRAVLVEGRTGSDQPTVPEEQNSWLFSGVQITNTMIGSGILTFPLALAKLGWFVFSLELLLFGSAVYATAMMLIEVGKRKEVFDYSRVTELVFGKTTARLLDFCIALSNLGALMTYFNVIGYLGSKVVRHWSDGASIFISSYSGFVVLIAVLDLPLLFLRSYGELTPISAVSLLFITFTVFFVAIDGQIAVDGGFLTAHFGPSSTTAVFGQLGTMSYAYSCQAVIFEAYQSTTAQDKPMFIKGSMLLATVAGGMLLASMAVWGYAAFGENSQSNILGNFNVHSTAVQVTMMVVVVHLALYIPNDFVILRLFAVHFFDPRLNVLQLTPFTFRAITLGLYAIPTLIMASVREKDVLGVFSYTIDLTGDLPMGFSCFVLPPALYLAVFNGSKDRESTLWWAACACLVLGTLLMVVCPIVDTISFVVACKSESGCSSY